MKKVLLFTAHPDDAEIAMGGTIMKLVEIGYKIKNVVVSIPDNRAIPLPNNIETRTEETRKSSEYMGIHYEFFDAIFPCSVEDIGRFELIRHFDRFIEDFKPNSIFTHWNLDSHQDHRMLSEAVKSCFRKYKCDLYFFEQTNQGNILHSNEFTPNVYVDISDYFERKIKALSFHNSQLSDYRKHYLDDVAKLAEWRGYQMNVKYAETFKLINKWGIE